MPLRSMKLMIVRSRDNFANQLALGIDFDGQGFDEFLAHRTGGHVVGYHSPGFLDSPDFHAILADDRPRFLGDVITAIRNHAACARALGISRREEVDRPLLERFAVDLNLAPDPGPRQPVAGRAAEQDANAEAEALVNEPS